MELNGMARQLQYRVKRADDVPGRPTLGCRVPEWSIEKGAEGRRVEQRRDVRREPAAQQDVQEDVPRGPRQRRFRAAPPERRHPERPRVLERRTCEARGD